MPMCIYYLVNQFVVSVGITLLYAVTGYDGTGSLTNEYMIMITVIQGIGMLAGCFCLLKDLKKEVPSFVGVPPKVLDWVFMILGGVSVALLLNIVFSMVGFTDSSESYQEVAQIQFSLPLWLGIILYGVIAPIAEEWVFRGVIYNRLKKILDRARLATKLGTPEEAPSKKYFHAMLGSALLFGMFHGNSVQMVYGTCIGFVLAWLYEKHNSFLVPVVIHGVINTLVYIVSTNESMSEVMFSAGNSSLEIALLLFVAAIGSFRFIMKGDHKI